MNEVLIADVVAGRGGRRGVEEADPVMGGPAPYLIVGTILLLFIIVLLKVQKRV